MTVSRPLKGLVAATVLPFDDDGKPDLQTYATFVDSLITAGVGGLAVNADSGEGMSLWADERRAVMSTAAEVADGRVPLVAGVIASFTAQACQLAEQAAEDGASYLMVFPNAHLRGQPLDHDVVLRYLDAIHASSGLPIVGFQLQDALGGVEFAPDLIVEIVTRDYVHAIKESTFDAFKFRSTMALVRDVAPDVSYLSGNDNFIYESFVLGADGALMGAGSVATSLQVQMFDAVQRRDFARAASLNEKLLPLMDCIFSAPIRDYRARTKEALVQLGLFPNAAVREPLLPLAPDAAATIKSALTQAGLL